LLSHGARKLARYSWSTVYEEIEFMLDLDNLKKVDNEMKREVFRAVLYGADGVDMTMIKKRTCSGQT
ncbi:hypothetical protein, partial [[Clostridium] scindens]|uniref:hypothetical protein n=1 Tax=Clostridium scindens (strain JCM 10418 / VPI 12708) TaxID=29347 RepID=UPI00241C0B6E